MAELHRAVAHMFCIGFDGPAISPHVEKMIDRGVSGVVLFNRNIESPQQLAKLCADLKHRAGRPFMIAIDQEGGRVRRLQDGFTDVPTMRELGKTGDAYLARQIGQVLARELRAVNVDWNFAPVLDVDTNPQNPVIGDRSLGGDPSLVARMGVALLQGIQGEGVAACGKHFPGHGDTQKDSHLDLPHLLHDRDRLAGVELHPFRAAVEAGVAAIMTSHIVFDRIDPENPATLSREILQGILREQLRFDGPIVSDDMEMKAISEHFGFEDALVRAANAGVDLLLVCHEAARQVAGIDAMVDAVQRGAVPRERVEQANLRVVKMFTQYVKPPSEADPGAMLRRPEHVAVADRVRTLARGGAS